jgi:hypothetical protein
MTFTVAAVAALVTAAVGSQVLYELLVVPQLSTIARVPVLWWIGVGAPLIVAAVVFGWLTTSLREGFATAGLAALAIQAVIQLAAWMGRPGWHKSFALEAPLDHWTLGVLSSFALLSVPVIMGQVGHAALHRPRTS